jgi:exosortase family protein XrtM
MFGNSKTDLKGGLFNAPIAQRMGTRSVDKAHATDNCRTTVMKSPAEMRVDASFSSSVSATAKMEQPKSKKVSTFLLLFIGVYTVLETAYCCVITDSALMSIYHWCIAVPAAQLLRLLDSADNVHAVSNQLLSNHVNFQIVRGCDASGVLFLLFAAIVAVPSSLAQKCRGVLGAVAVAYALNELRVLTLYGTQRLDPGSFNLMHVYVLPLMILLLSTQFFVSWQRRAHLTRPLSPLQP